MQTVPKVLNSGGEVPGLYLMCEFTTQNVFQKMISSPYPWGLLKERSTAGNGEQASWSGSQPSADTGGGDIRGKCVEFGRVK